MIFHRYVSLPEDKLINTATAGLRHVLHFGHCVKPRASAVVSPTFKDGFSSGHRKIILSTREMEGLNGKTQELRSK